MFTWLFFCLFSCFSATSAEFEDVYLWKGKYSLKDQSISIPQYLIITSYHSPPSALFQKVNRFLVPPSLDGGECSANRDRYFSRKVKAILPPKTSLKVIEAFHILKDPGLIRKLVVKLLDFKGIGVKGGPATYYLVRDSQKKEFILNEIIAYEPNFYFYDSLPAKRVANILSHFTKPNQEARKVLLSFELTEEHNEKCGWGWPKGQKPERMEPEKEIKVLMERSVQFMQKHSSLYTFEDIQSHSDQVEVRLDNKALAFLILNSSPLRIKDISLLNGS